MRVEAFVYRRVWAAGHCVSYVKGEPERIDRFICVCVVCVYVCVCMLTGMCHERLFDVIIVKYCTVIHSLKCSLSVCSCGGSECTAKGGRGFVTGRFGDFGDH